MRPLSNKPLPTNPGYIITQIKYLRQNGRHDDAFELLARALKDERHKNNTVFWNMAGQIYLEFNDNAKAREFFSATLEVNSNDLYALKGMFNTYKNERDRNMAGEFKKRIRKILGPQKTDNGPHSQQVEPRQFNNSENHPSC